jgi:hypothetical protein
MSITQRDRSIVRALAEQQAEIASLPVHKEKAAEWSRLNGLGGGRPLVWINEIPWHEMDVDGELELQTTDPFCRDAEQTLRRTIYQWDHMPVDMIVEAKFYSPLVIHDTEFGIAEDVDVVQQDERSDIVSRDFHPQIDSEGDLDKIKTPIVTHDEEASERNRQTLVDIFGDILPIESIGIVHQWFAPWDELIRWWDVEKALTDLVLRPQLVHLAMDRLTDAYLARLAQWEEQNLLSVTEGNYRVGSGGPGYTAELPQPDFDPARVRPVDQWGCGTAQIFSAVSPEMHEEFALQYERRWMRRFGLNYYGCCEPLHRKIDVLTSIPNLRKISMSPWADVEKMVERTNGAVVLSHKPNPAVLAKDTWNPAQARQALVEVGDKTRGCPVEIILKDISTVRYQPRRLWEWSEIAMDVARSDPAT